MSISDKDIGQRIRHARKAADMNQAELAARMRDLGWKWSQSSVVAIEKHGRPLQHTELVEAANVLGVEPWTLWAISNTSDIVVSIAQADFVSARAAERSLRHAVGEYERARRELARSADFLLENLAQGDVGAAIAVQVGSHAGEVVAGELVGLWETAGVAATRKRQAGAPDQFSAILRDSWRELGDRWRKADDAATRAHKRRQAAAPNPEDS